MNNSQEAKLYDGKTTYKVKDIWSGLPAHTPAQGLSTQNSHLKRLSSKLSQENHLSISQSLSPPNFAVSTDLPLSTLYREGGQC